MWNFDAEKNISSQIVFSLVILRKLHLVNDGE